jgi:hypothetical protein
MESAETPHEFQAIYRNHLPAREAGGQHLGRLGSRRGWRKAGMSTAPLMTRKFA